MVTDIITNEHGFYIECVLGGYTDFTSEKNVEKAKLLAQRYNLEYPYGIERLFDLCASEYYKLRETRKQRALNEVIEADQKLCNQLSRYKDETGREKRIKMLSDMIQEAKQEQARRLEASRYLAKISTQKTMDWATLGGAVSGVAGPIAGAVTALNVQAQNASINAQNQRNLKEVAPSITNLLSQAGEYGKTEEELKKRIAEVQEKLVGKESPETVFGKLEFHDIQYQVRDTGAVLVRATVTAHDLKVYDSPNAIVDGTIIADVMQGEKKNGEVYLVLPLYGMPNDTLTELVGMSMLNAKPGQEYSINLRTKNLWEMEP